MRSAIIPAIEPERMRVLRETGLLDTSPEKCFDDLVQLAAFICGTPIAMVSLVDSARQWFKSRVGLDRTETPRESAFCAHAILQTETMIVPDASADERFLDNPLVVGNPHIRFYAGVPLVVAEDAGAIGTLCVIDRIPRDLTPEQRTALDALGRQVLAQIDLRRRAVELQRVQSLKDELMTLIMHDIKTPLAGVLGSLQGVKDGLTATPDVRQLQLATDRVSVAAVNMQQVIDGIAELRSLEDGGVPLHRTPQDAEALVRRSVASLEAIAHARDISVQVVVEGQPTLQCDPTLVCRALENLLLNAVNYSPASACVSISTRITGGGCEFVVVDRGPGMPDKTKISLFHLKVRSPEEARERGFGLGLYLVKLVADAHKGGLSVRDEEGGGTSIRLFVPAPGRRPATLRL